MSLQLTRDDDGKEYICRNDKLVTVKWYGGFVYVDFPFNVYHDGTRICTVDKNGFQSFRHEPGMEWDVIRLATDAERIAAALPRWPVAVEKIPTPEETSEAKTRLQIPPRLMEADDANCSTGFVVKDSGERQQFASGMQRDTSAGKTDYETVFNGPMLDRWAEHMTKGAVKYPDVEGQPNWMLANGTDELRRARKSAIRHFRQWLRGDRDEDHAAAVFFNINLACYVADRMNKSDAA